MAAAAPVSHPSKDAAILRLPPELLAIIADFVFKGAVRNFGDKITDRRRLCPLRLTHRNFAYLRPLMANLFEWGSMTPHIGRENLDWSFCGPFAKMVHFDTKDKCVTTELSAIDQYVKSGRARLAFTKALREFKNLDEIRIHLAPEGPIHYSPHPKDLFSLAVQSLKDANIAPKQLEIWHEGLKSKVARRMWHIPDWQDLNFARLERLDLHDDALNDERDFDDARPNQHDECDALLSALDQCSGTLKQICFELGNVVLWPQHYPVPQMPKLASIQIAECFISPKAIATLISQCPNLKGFSLERIYIEGVREIRVSHLEPIIHALRQHKNEIDYNISAEVIDPFDWSGAGRLYFLLANWDEPMEDEPEEDDEELMYQMMNDYISGDGRWRIPAGAFHW